jgi:ribonuclease HII
MYRRCGFRYEKKLRALGVVRIAGIDEAGRGALAGPVVAAAVILPEKFRHRKLKDSKQLLPDLRQEIYDELVSREDIVWSIGVVDSFEIDQINILRATHKAMRSALEGSAGHPIMCLLMDFRSRHFLCRKPRSSMAIASVFPSPPRA